MKLNKLAVLTASAVTLFSTAMPTVAKAAEENDSALTGIASTGEEDGGESDSKHIYNDKDTDIHSGKSYAGVGFTPGELSLRKVPNFDFGYHKLLTQNMDLLHVSTKNDDTVGGKVDDRSLIVEDARRSAENTTDMGWTVTVNWTGFYDADDFNKNVLKEDGNNLISFDETKTDGRVEGANLTLGGTDTSITQVSPIYDENDSNTAVTGAWQEATEKTGTAPDGATRTLGDADRNGATSQTIFSTTNTNHDQGVGAWAYQFDGTKSAHLYFPGSQQNSDTQYIAGLNWTLSANPVV